MSSSLPLSPYPSPREYEDMLDDIEDKGDALVVQYGKSVEGRPLRGACFPSGSRNPRRLLCTGGIHGPEFISSLIALSMISALSRQDPVFKNLREKAEIWIIPCLNPDAYARTWELEGRGPISLLRTNTNGVDLNRNFPLPRGEKRRRFPGTGSPRKGDITYRGKKPLSEPETGSLEQFLSSRRFHASVNLHSFMGSVIPPRVTDGKNFRTYRELARIFRNAQPRYRYRCLSSRFLDFFTGELEDHLHHNHGCWSICVETMTLIRCMRQNLPPERIFWLYNPRKPGIWIENELQGINAYFNAALELPSPAPVS